MDADRVVDARKSETAGIGHAVLIELPKMCEISKLSAFAVVR